MSRSRHEELDLLGDQLLNALKFARSGFSPELLLTDHVEQESVRASVMFECQRRGCWFMRQASLPGDLAVKAIGIDGRALQLETALLDPSGVERALREHVVALTYDARTCTFRTVSGSRPVATVTTGKVPRGVSPRCLWTILWRSLAPESLQLAIRAADAVYRQSAYADDGEALTTQGAAREIGKIDIELRLDIVQMLAHEQRPILSLGMLPTLAMELRPIQALERRLLTMSPEELAEYAMSDLSAAGQRRILQAFIFTLAGRIKRSMPELNLSWKRARAIARARIFRAD